MSRCLPAHFLGAMGFGLNNCDVTEESIVRFSPQSDWELELGSRERPILKLWEYQRWKEQEKKKISKIGKFEVCSTEI